MPGIFSDAAHARELCGSGSRIACLQFRRCEGCPCLFANEAVLAAWSGVLRPICSEADDLGPAYPGTPGRGRSVAAAIITAVERDFSTIPLDDTDTAAWEDALALMHPSRQTARLSFGSAARLLLLAPKYDMPAVTGHVEAFLMEDVITTQAAAAVSTLPVSTSNNPRSRSASDTVSGSSSSSSSSSSWRRSSSTARNPPLLRSRLAAHLTPETAPGWLQLTSACGLDTQADVCVDYLVQQHHDVSVNVSLLSSIQPQHADRLLSGLLAQLQLASDTAAKQEQALATAALPLKTATRRAKCPGCKAPWYVLPDGRSTPYCFSCGRRRPIILGQLYQPVETP